MFDVSKFSAYISKTGTLPVNRFQVTIPVPSILLSAGLSKDNTKIDITSLANDMVMRAESVRVPGIAINTAQVNRYGVGPIQKFPNNGNFTDTAITFICDKDSLVWAFFYHWLNGVFAFDEKNPDSGKDITTYRANYKQDYCVDINIDVFEYGSNAETDEAGVTTIKPSSSFLLYDAFPTSMNDVTLDWGTNNNIVKLTITFAFTDWEFLDTNRTILLNRTAQTIPTTVIPKDQATVAGANTTTQGAASPP